MPQTLRSEVTCTLVAPSANIDPFIDHIESTSENAPSSYPSSLPETPKISVHNSSTNLLAYRTTIKLKNCANLRTESQPRSSLDTLIRITDIILIIGAVIIAISLCITFSTVGVAVYRMCSSEGVAKIGAKNNNNHTMNRIETLH